MLPSAWILHSRLLKVFNRLQPFAAAKGPRVGRNCDIEAEVESVLV